MRLSRYNVMTTSDRGGLLLFNARSCAMVGLEPDFYRRYLDPEHGDPNLAPAELQAEFRTGHFAVDDGVDELEEYRFERARTSFATDRLELVIAPTLDCNLACVYCYEQVRRPGVMKPPVIQALKDMVAARLKTVGRLGVTWYGGEPLLALGVIEELGAWLSAQAQAHGVLYEANILTNGLLLTPDVARGLAKLGITAAQVPLDGPAAVHDLRRPRAGGQGTFSTILQNLTSASGDLHVAIRVAVDRDNRDQAWELYEDLRRRGLAGRCQVLVRPLCESPGVCRSAAVACMSLPGFFAWHLAGLRRRLEAGLPVNGLDDLYPRPGTGCMGTRLDLVMVDPEGLMQRCLEEVGVKERSVGSIDKLLAFGPLLQKWMALDPVAVPRCRECRFLPLCGGGCPGRWMRDGRPECSPYMTVLEEVLRIHERWPQAGPARPPAAPSGGPATGPRPPESREVRT